MQSPHTINRQTAPLFIDVVTRNLTDLDEPAQRTTINLHNPISKVWLAKHSWWSLHNNHSVTTAPKQED